MGNERLTAVRDRMRENGIDSLLVNSRHNIRYITGFKGEYGYAGVTPGKLLLFTTQLYEEEARATVVQGCEVVPVTEDSIKSLAREGPAFWGGRIGYESETLFCSVFNRLTEALKFAELVPTTGLIEHIRTVKNTNELTAISAAQDITGKVFEEILGLLVEGVEERDIANEIDYRFRSNGGERPAFETIVAFGPDSSRPHAVPGACPLKKGDIVLFDMGTVVDGYVSDMTRTVVFGRAEAEQKRRYGIVTDAQEAALGSIKAGVTCAESYRAAYDVFDRAGYSDRFIHSLGHGLGLEVHERPRLSPKVDDPLLKNTVVTVEPGLYFPGWGGIRIEDMVVVDDGGYVNLTKTTKTLLEV